jgi:hypothetical protein
MEHKHFVTFEQEIMSFPCYETTLSYCFESKSTLSILRIDRSIVDMSEVNEGTILFTTNPTYTNEISVLKEFLIDLFSYSGNCYGYPIFSHSEVITENEFNHCLQHGIENISTRKNQIRANSKDHPIILYCTENKLYPEPEDHSPDSWKANCPSGRQHHIMISTSSPSSHNWGCGYCKKKGGLEELKQWVEKKNHKI